MSTNNMLAPSQNRCGAFPTFNHETKTSSPSSLGPTLRALRRIPDHLPRRRVQERLSCLSPELSALPESPSSRGFPAGTTATRSTYPRLASPSEVAHPAFGEEHSRHCHHPPAPPLGGHRLEPPTSGPGSSAYPRRCPA